MSELNKYSLKQFFLNNFDAIINAKIWQNVLMRTVALTLCLGFLYFVVSIDLTLYQQLALINIELLVNESAKKAMISKARITMEFLEQTIKSQKPTVSLSELKKYESIRRKIEEDADDDKPDDRPSIGYKF